MATKSKDRYFLLKRKVGYEDYKQLMHFPLVRLGKNKSGFIAVNHSIRLNPYQMLAYRTIGLDRENAQKWVWNSPMIQCCREQRASGWCGLLQVVLQCLWKMITG